jgi:hypothetical protein
MNSTTFGGVNGTLLRPTSPMSEAAVIEQLQLNRELEMELGQQRSPGEHGVRLERSSGGPHALVERLRLALWFRPFGQERHTDFPRRVLFRPADSVARAYHSAPAMQWAEVSTSTFHHRNHMTPSTHPAQSAVVVIVLARNHRLY